VLIDALPLALAKEHVEKRAQRIASAYYRLGSIRDDIRQIEHRDIFRATVLFGTDRVEPTGRRAFAAEMVRRDSDETIDATQQVPPAFGEAVTAAIVPF
jgi:hypothetical protein